MIEEQVNETEQILEWKNRYGNIYATEVNDITFVYRMLSDIEYETVKNQSIDNMDMDERICHLCVLDPLVDWHNDDLFAGYISSLSQIIQEESLLLEREDGSNNVKYLIEQKSRELENSFLLQMPVIIQHAFPAYSFEELERMDRGKQVDLYVKAMWSIKFFEGIELSLDE